MKAKFNTLKGKLFVLISALSLALGVSALTTTAAFAKENGDHGDRVSRHESDRSDRHESDRHNSDRGDRHEGDRGDRREGDDGSRGRDMDGDWDTD